MFKKHGVRRGAVKIRGFDLDVKASADAAGKFSGHGSVFGIEDSYGEIVAPGAFAESLQEIGAKGRPVPVLWQHRSGEPIGVYDVLKEDDRGLYVEGRLAIEKVVRAAEAYALVEMEAVSGLSIGYWVRESTFDEKTKIRTLTKLDLVEISLVTFPANDEARVDTIKAKLAHGGLPDLNEFEKFLREAGFSKTQSAVIANRGLAHLLRSESAGAGEKQAEIDRMKTMLDGFSLPQL